MAINTAISLSNISKVFKQYHRPIDRLQEILLPKKQRSVDFWALRDIDLEVMKGETVGIVGRNGSGKSTLLQIIAGTLQPTTGDLKVYGRISALLELGSGFNPEFTGRQNVFFNGRILGLSQTEIAARFDKIATFADIGEFIDQPVKTYSSGMFVRLAFSVAVHVDPEILIVDEALAVGDVLFQHRCMQCINSLADAGTTILFVSHDASSILRLCNRAILLEEGCKIREGDPESTIDLYNALIAKKKHTEIEQITLESGKVKTVSGNGKATVREVSLHNSIGDKVKAVNVGEPVELRVCVEVLDSIESLVLGYSIKDRLGHVMYGTNTWHTKQVLYHPSVNCVYVFSIKFSANLGVGSYSVQIALVDQETHLTENYEWCDLALVFEVINANKTFFIGCLWNEPKIMVEKT